MPIYEFKCLKCEEYIEILVMGSDDKNMQMTCTKCGGQELERIMSTTNVSVAPSGGSQSKVTSQTRSCSGGSCTTWNLPGHSR